jgi:NAD+ synthase
MRYASFCGQLLAPYVKKSGEDMNTFNKKILEIDCNAEAKKISDFMKKTVLRDYRRRGVVVGLSGGIDSALTAALSVKTFGKERVLGIILPEKESSSESEVLAHQVADWLGIKTETVLITPILESLGVYRRRETLARKYFPEFTDGWKYKMAISKDTLEREGLNIFHLIVIEKGGAAHKDRLSLNDYLEMVAATDMKQRTRMMQLYFYAEKSNFIVAGTTNKSELLQGFFVKYGDGGVDMEPIAHLYKMQVFQLSEFLSVPQEIIRRTPSPDTWSAGVSDEEFYFRVPYDLLDLLLYAHEQEIPLEDVSKVLDMVPEKILRFYKDFDSKNKATWHLRAMPPNLIEPGK